MNAEDPRDTGERIERQGQGRRGAGLLDPLVISRIRRLAEERDPVPRGDPVAIGDGEEGPQARSADAAARLRVDLLLDGLRPGLFGQLKNDYAGPPSVLNI